MEIRSFDDWQVSLRGTRRVFAEATEESKSLVREAFGLFVELLDLMPSHVSSKDDVALALELLATGGRIVLSSYILLENGLVPETKIVLRNALELMLIAIEVIHNNTSRERWKATKDADPIATSHSEFTARNILRRIRNQTPPIPQSEVEFAEHIYREWEHLSRGSAHMLLYSQLKAYVNPDGKLKMGGWLFTEHYEQVFRQFAVYFFNAASLLLGAPALRWILEDPAEESSITQFRHHFRQMSEVLLWSGIRTKAELLVALRNHRVFLDFSSLPDDAVIKRVEVDFSSPDNPQVRVDYDGPPENGQASPAEL